MKQIGFFVAGVFCVILGCAKFAGEKKQEFEKIPACDSLYDRLILYVSSTDFEISSIIESSSAEKISSLDTILLPCNTELYTFYFFDVVLSVISIENGKYCEIIDSDNISKSIVSGERLDIIHEALERINGCEDVSFEDVQNIIEAVCDLSGYKIEGGSYDSTLAHLAASLPSTLPSHFFTDSSTVYFKIDSLVIENEMAPKEGFVSFYYYPDYTKLICLKISETDPTMFSLQIKSLSDLFISN